MTRWGRAVVLGVLALQLLSTGHAHAAAKPAPISVQILYSNRLSMYDCWPSEDAAGIKVQVFLNYQEGLAIYNCWLVDEVWIMPIWRFTDVVV